MDAGHHGAVGVEVEAGGFGQGGQDVQLDQSFDQHNSGGKDDLGTAEVEVALQSRGFLAADGEVGRRGSGRAVLRCPQDDEGANRGDSSDVAGCGW
ncbi:hypothetical protein OG594_24085 [Streptomyces sp. NBC_01214]|uniref:hypothetical protein n=1 Tax=Streptomyces sp. NBC_01214 TaxID=2903777 RepID=UPI00224D11BF|nr:hypothetical protein [Streptomyces sp. NBC_01214]MCX4804660.1 hypothetical protein [Streptomyces sp. NBC_01214]